jgi:diamine N-acetyltransferase
MSDPIHLAPVDRVRLRAVLALRVAPEQERFVAPNAVSLAEAYVSPEARPFIILLGERPVGFVMLEVWEERGEYGVWRMMIDHAHQGQGYGRLALDHVVAYVRTLPRATKLYVTCVPGEGSPEGFYRRYGFEPTGEVLDGEVVLVLAV